MTEIKITPDLCGAIRVAAKAGFLPKEVWREYFARGNTRWQNRQWKELTDSKVFRTVNDYGFVKSAIALAERGKALAVKLGLDPIYIPPARNLYHDQELIRFVLFLEKQGWISNWMTESEIKFSNKSEKFFKNQHRPPKIPDLVIEWNRSQDKILWAVELERTRKDMHRYYEMVGAYRGISNIDSVLVITASDSIEVNIKRAQGKLNYPQSQRPMIFASLHEASSDPSSCELRVGSNRTTLGSAALALTNIKTKVAAKTDKIQAQGMTHYGLTKDGLKNTSQQPENTGDASASAPI